MSTDDFDPSDFRVTPTRYGFRLERLGPAQEPNPDWMSDPRLPGLLLEAFNRAVRAAKARAADPRCGCGHLESAHWKTDTTYDDGTERFAGDCALCGKRCGMVPR